MCGEDGSVWVALNGEIYGCRELQRELEKLGHAFRTSCDTEVLAHGYEEWGDALVDRLDGMFAFCVWDTRARRVLLGRDRAGEKPLYYIADGERLIFASELVGLMASGLFEPQIDATALSKYRAHDFVPSPSTILRDVRKLSPGMVLSWDGRVALREYWKVDFTPEPEPPDARERFQSLLEQAVRRRLLSDVPVGAFLSGGVDSSAVTSFLPCGTATFSAGFEDAGYDETSHARAAAERLGMFHREWRFTTGDCLRAVPEVGKLLDEPLADASFVPTLLLCRRVRAHVKVALGGDGGDELLAGYPTFTAHSWAGVLRPFVPILQMARRLLPVGSGYMNLRFKVEQYLKGARAAPELRHPMWLSSFTSEGVAEEIAATLRGAGDPLQAARTFYFRYYLGDQVLQKVDRASMSCGLEVRSPFLDRDLVAFAAKLPIRAIRGKRLLRGRVPAATLARPKHGFGMPVAQWFRSELRDLTRDALAASEFREEGLSLLDRHERGEADHRKELWNLLVFELWRRERFKP